MGVTRWVQRHFCFDAASCSLRYGDTVEAAEAILQSKGDLKGNKQIIPLFELSAPNLKCGTFSVSQPTLPSWVAAQFTIDRPASLSNSHSMVLRKESASSGIWFDALYSVIFFCINHGRAWGSTKEQCCETTDFLVQQQVLQYSAWAKASLEERLHNLVLHRMQQTQKFCIAAVDGGSMKLVQATMKDGFLSMPIQKSCADRNAVLHGLHFTPSSTVSFNPSWGTIVSNVHMTSFSDMYSYGQPLSIAFHSSSFLHEDVSVALTNAIRLRSKPCPDVKVKGNVNLWIYEDGVKYVSHILQFSGSSTLVLEGTSLCTAPTDAKLVGYLNKPGLPNDRPRPGGDKAKKLQAYFYLSHCTGILPVQPHARHTWMFSPFSNGPNDPDIRGRSCYLKIANCKVVFKSSNPKSVPHGFPELLNADVVLQTSGKSARDQWITIFYQLKKSSVIVPPLLPSAPLPSEASTQPLRDLRAPVHRPEKPEKATARLEPTAPPPPPSLCVILPISNPIAFRRREQLFKETLGRMLTEARDNPALCVVSVRLSYTSNPTPGIRFKSHGKQRDHNYVDLLVETAADDVLWAKENLINIGIKWVLGDARLGQSVEVSFFCTPLTFHPPPPHTITHTNSAFGDVSCRHSLGLTRIYSFSAKAGYTTRSMRFVFCSPKEAVFCKCSSKLSSLAPKTNPCTESMHSRGSIVSGWIMPTE